MKNLQEAINNHVMNSRNHKRYLAALIAMSMLVSFMVPFLLIEPAVSLTNDSEISPQAAGAMLTNYANADGNDGYSPKERSEVELLVGNGVEWASDCTTASEVIEKAKEEYFLGIAYDFSLFLEGTATLKNADAEGRVAVGGNLIFTGGYCYQVGSGNFGYMTALKDTDDYQGITNFAHAIVGGYMKNIHPLSTGNNRMRINQLTTEKGGHQGYEETLYFPPTEDMFKRFVVGADINNDDFTHMHCSNEKYNANGSHDSVSVNELAEMYKQPEDGVINFTSTFEWLRERSIKLGEKTATGEATSNGNKVTFKIPDGMENAKTVYFDLPDNVDYSKLEEIRFENVPKDTTEMIVRETETDELKKITKNIPKCNLVINAKDTSFDIRGVGNTTKTIIKYTDNTEDEISNNIDLEKRDEYNKNDIHHNNEISNDNGAVVPCRSNNHPASSKILYNFPNAKTGTINGNFNGTIFAPDANIKSDDNCTGHLSGALIAKSFEGGLEFGYRPYRGTSDILGSNSGYVVPVDKLIKGTETYLPNASFTITDNNTNKIVDRWKSGDATEFVVIPSLVDFSGKINYNTETNQYVKTYTIAESSSPNGYIKTDKNYTVSVTETVNKDYLLKFGEGTIPQVVDVEITINSSDTTETAFPKTIKFQYRDSYDETADGMAQTQRKILVYDGENVSKVFTLNINTVGGSQTVTQLGTIDNWTDNCDVEEIASPQVTEAVSEETTEAVETTTEPIATENEISEEQNNDIPTESAPEIEPVDENANSADEVSGEQSADNAVTQYRKIKPIESTEITPPDGKDLKSSWEFTVDENNRYYYDNNSMMVIPLPDSNLKFENKPGLLFTKVDKTTGEILEEAEISIVPIVDDFSNDVKAKGSFLFDIESLTENQVYTLTEGNPPPNYEKKDEPIYLQKRDGKLYYGETNPPETEIEKNTDGYYSFSMEDVKISGAVPSLKKTDENDAILAGASFELWAKDGTSAICSWENFSGKETSMKEKLLTVTDTTYVVNGYLQPGVYYLEETVIPKKNDKDYYENPGKMYFTVNKDFTITNGYVDAKQLKVVQADPHEIKFGAEDGSVLNNITSITWESNGVKSIYDTDPTINDIDGNYHNNYTYTAKAFNQKLGNNYAFKLANWGDGKPNLEVYYVEVIADGQKYIYNNRPSNASLMALSSDDADEENGISPLTDGEGKELTIDHYEHNNGSGVDMPIFKASDNSINNAKYIYVESNDSQVQIYNTNNSPWEGKKVNVRENKKPENADIASFDNIKLQPCDKWSSDFAVTYVRITAEDGTQYIYGTPSSDVPEPSDDGGGNTGGNTGDNPSGNTGSDGESIENPHLTVTDKLLTVKNTRPGDNKSITVEKVWEDGEFKSGRTDITVQLYRTTDTVDYNNLPTNDDANKVGDAVTLNASGDTPWKYTWSTLPSYVENSDDTWNYYVKEVATPSGYTVQYSASGNEFKITNTLQKDEISITKKWENTSGTNLTKPNQLNVTLKFTINGTQQTKTVTLTPKEDSSGDYTGSYEIPKGADPVSVEENSVPTGWKFKAPVTGDKETGFTITNVPDYTQLTVKKEWDDGNNSNNRPEKIRFKLYRKVQSGGSSGGNADAPNFDPNLTNDLVPDYENITGYDQYNDYARLLQYSLYFYDANMCGSDVSEKSAFSKTKNQTNGWRDDCHTYTTDKDYVDGGFHDAGDHLMLGLPQGFTAATLGWSYYEFRNSYDSLGLTDHYKTIMEYFCDFFVNSVRYNGNDVSELLVQKGSDGGNQRDHAYWGSPEAQQQNEFGKMWWESSNVSNVAAEYAAALAIYKLNFPTDSKSDNYLEVAKKLYAFAEKSNGCWCAEGLYSDNECASEKAWAAAWLYLATKDSSYKEKCEDLLKSLKITDKRGYFWGDVTPGAMAVYASHINNTENSWSKVKNYLSDHCLSDHCLGSNYEVLDGWGSARHNTLLQTIALVATKNGAGVNYEEWCENQMNMILGENSKKICLVVGYANNSSTSPHHRAASGLTGWDNGGYNSYSGTDKGYEQISGSHILVGALCGGPGSSDFNTYQDKLGDSTSNEVTLDYNAGLVAAAAGLYHFNKTGKTYSNVTDAAQDESANALSAVGPMKLNFNVNVNVLDAAEGNPVASYTGPYDGDNNKTLTIDPTISNVTKIEFQFDKVESWGGFSGVNLNEENANWHQASDFTVNGDIYTLTLDKFELSKIIFNMYGSQAKNIKIYTSGSGNDPTPTTTTTTTKKEETPTTTTTTTADTSGLDAHEYKFNGDFNNNNLNLKHVKKIAVVFDNQCPQGQDINGMLKINNGAITLPGNANADQGSNNFWKITSGNRFEYGDVDIDINQFEFAIWNAPNGRNGKVIFYTEPEGIKITPESDEITEGEDMTITANMAATWEITDGEDLIENITFTGTEYKFKAKDNVHGTVKITAKADGKSDTATITIKGKTITGLPEAVKLHVRKPAQLSPVPADNVSYNSGNEAVATVDNNGNITARSTGDTVITVSRNGESVSVPVHVLGDLSITGNGIMNKNATQQLTAANAVGAVKWSINPDSNEPKIKIDPDTGVVTSETGTGNATVIATDSDGTTAEFNIIVNLTAVQPDLPEGAEQVQNVGVGGIITLTKYDLKSDGSWQIDITDLPKTDSNGNVYVYYLEEVDKYGNRILQSIPGQGGVQYYPVEYRNNGITLNGESPTITVKNEASEKPENPDYTLPNTGGIGTGGFTTAGGAIIIGSTALYILSKRRRKKNVVR